MLGRLLHMQDSSVIEMSKFSIVRGRGVEGTVGTKKIIIGNRTLMKERDVPLNNYEKQIKAFESEGKTTMIVAEDKKIIGVIAVADAIKNDSMQTLQELHAAGYRTIMITGDNETTAKAIAQQAGISEVIANVLPEDKAKK